MAASQSEKEHRFWNAVGLLLFVGLCAISFALIFSYGDFGVDHVGLLDLALLGLATFRLIHLISYDRVLDFSRVLVMDSEGKPAQDRRPWVAPSGQRVDGVPLVCGAMVRSHRGDRLCHGKLGSAWHSVVGSSWPRIAVASDFQSGRYRAVIYFGSRVQPYLLVNLVGNTIRDERNKSQSP